MPLCCTKDLSRDSGASSQSPSPPLNIAGDYLGLLSMTLDVKYARMSGLL